MDPQVGLGTQPNVLRSSCGANPAANAINNFLMPCSAAEVAPPARRPQAPAASSACETDG